LRSISAILVTLVVSAYTTPSAAASVPQIGVPQLGPIARAPEPLVFISESVNSRSYNMGGVPPGAIGTGAIVSIMNSISDARYSKASQQTAEAVRKAFPDLSLESEMPQAFHCGEANSLCTEFVPFTPSKEGPSLQALLRSHGWKQARVLTAWWEKNSDDLGARATIVEISDTGADELSSNQPVFLGYYITAPRKAKDGTFSHADEWESGSEMPRTTAMRAAITGLEPLAQMAMSWGTNNDNTIFKQPRGVLIRQARDQAIDCRSLRLCVAELEGVVNDRTWTWLRQHESPNRKKYGMFVYELQSRSRVAP
jgi:hypothetical protein